MTAANERQVDTSAAITRTSSPALDEILGHAFPVLDHGFVRVIDYMGDDAAIAQAARTSYAKGTKSTSDDAGLIRYLMRHHHTTPFEMCEIKLHVKLPVFVARQWIRHRTANVNEMSARYSILDREFYIPEPENMAAQSTTNNQGRGEVLDEDDAWDVIHMLKTDCQNAYESYKEMLSAPAEGGYGLARELARMNLPTNIYTQWYWKTDLHNLFHFMRLRSDPHAQWEIRVYSQLIEGLVQQWVPEAYRAWVDYRRDAVTFSRVEIEVLQDYIACLPTEQTTNMRSHLAHPELSARELNDLLTKVGVKS